MKSSKIMCLLGIFLLVAIGCSDDKAQQPLPQFDGSTNNVNNTEQDMSEPDMTAEVDMTEVEDTGPEPDLSVDMPGFLHGTWTVEVLDGDPDVEGVFATITIRHESGAESASGVFKSEFGEGQLGTTTWLDDTLSTGFDIRIDNTTERFGITNGVPDGEDTINGRYSWAENGTFGNVLLTRDDS